MTAIPYRRFPCSGCPWSRETTPGAFPADRYDELAATAGSPGAEAPIGTPMFGCHNERPGRGEADAALATGDLPVEALTPGAGWPDLYETYAEMAAAQGRLGTDYNPRSAASH